MFVKVKLSTQQGPRLMGGFSRTVTAAQLPAWILISPLLPQSHGREKMFLPPNEMIVSVIYSCWSLHPSVRSVMINLVTGYF